MSESSDNVRIEGTADVPTESFATGQQDDVFDIFQKLETVTGTLLMDKEGYIARSNLDEGTSGVYCSTARQILHTVRTRLSKVGNGEQPKLSLIRINSGTQELTIFPIQEENLCLIIVQSFSQSSNQVGDQPDENL